MIGRFKTWLGLIRSLIPDALAVAGAFFIVRGVWLVYRPAGFIAAGILLIAGAVVVSKGGSA